MGTCTLLIALPHMTVNKVCSAFGSPGFLEVGTVFEGRVTRNASLRLLCIVTCQEVETVFEGRVTRNASFRLLPPLGFYNIKRAGGKSKA